MTVTIVIIALALGTVALKSVGPVLAGRRQPSAPLARVISLSAPAVIAALVATETLTEGQELVVDARVVGLAVGGTALWFRLPVVMALVLAAAASAGVRSLT